MVSSVPAYRKFTFDEWRKLICPIYESPLDMQRANPILWLYAMCRKWFDGEMKRV